VFAPRARVSGKDELPVGQDEIDDLIRGVKSAPLSYEFDGDESGEAKRQADGLRGKHSFSPEYVKYPPPPENLKLLHASIFLRHGDRTPISRSVGTAINAEEDRDFWASLLPEKEAQRWWDTVSPVVPESVSSEPYDLGNTPFGQLTERGAMECRQFGAHIRERYIERLGLLPREDPNLQDIKIRTTNLRRTQQTAQNFLEGLYPVATRNPNDHTIPISTCPLGEETLIPNAKTCPKCMRMMQRAAKEALGEQIVIKGEREIMRNLGYPPKQVKWAQAREVMTCYLLQGKPLPNNLTEHDIDRLGDINGFIWGAQYGDQDIARLSVGRIMAEVVDDMASAMDDPDDSYKIAMYAGHDSTLVPILSALGVYDNKWPSYAANIVFELAEEVKTGEMYVRVLYNNEEMLLMDQFWNDFDEFYNYMAYYVTSDKEYYEECQEPDLLEEYEARLLAAARGEPYQPAPSEEDGSKDADATGLSETI